MRDILFRGKRKDNGEWVYGYYVEAEKLDKSGTEYFIIEKSADGASNAVIPKTVGQCTGLEDKNGNLIFEGDIVRYATCVHEVVFESRNGSGYFGIVIGEMETWPFGSSPADLMEVIGNIQDNPILLEAQHEN